MNKVKEFEFTKTLQSNDCKVNKLTLNLQM